LSAIVALSKRLIEDRTMGSKFQKAMAVAAVLAAVGAGLAAGYVIWGWPTNWYAGHDVSTLRPGPEMDLIRYGQQIVGDTARHIGRNATDPAKRYAGNDLACSHCHINSGLKPFGIPLVSTFATFPMMVDEHVMSLAQRINGCMTRSMNGRPLPTDSREMEAIVAYLQFIGRKTPQGVRVAGMGLPPLRAPARAPTPVQGEKVYASQCAKCHKDQGQGEPLMAPGVGYEIPPLWGDDSFNSAAGMSRIETAAAFIHANMPIGADYREPMLTVQEAWDVAAFVTSKPRPALRAGPTR
jgi:thiosulfate dehydrogenase